LELKGKSENHLVFLLVFVEAMEYYNSKICRKCKGKCCKELPGSAIPSDFEPDIENNLIVALKTGKWAIDWWEGDPTGKGILDLAYFIRPAVVGKEGVIKDPSWGGICVFLKSNGCALKKSKRPTCCKSVEPKKDGKCIAHLDKKAAAILWLPFNEMIEKIIERLKG
jgi:hypothetical protein